MSKCLNWIRRTNSMTRIQAPSDGIRTITISLNILFRSDLI